MSISCLRLARTNIMETINTDMVRRRLLFLVTD
jgi:hypothetical protein